MGLLLMIWNITYSATKLSNILFESHNILVSHLCGEEKQLRYFMLPSRGTIWISNCTLKNNGHLSFL
jgi:hypothetical protein